MYCVGSAGVTLRNPSIASSEQGQSVYCQGTTGSPILIFTCCNIDGSAGGDWVGYITDQYGINGNFSEDPLFCNAEGSDFTLCADSPCLPGNHPSGADTCGLIGAWDVGCPICGAVAVEETSWDAVKASYR